MSNRLSYKTTSGELHFKRLILFSLISPGAEPGVLHKSSHLFSLTTLSGKCYESHFLDEGMKAQTVASVAQCYSANIGTWY